MLVGEMNALEQNRPTAVVAFETLSLVVLGFELVFVYGLSWESLVSIPLMLWIILSVTRRRSAFARWAFTAIYGIGFALVAYLAAVGMLKPSDMQWTGWVLSITPFAELALLWSHGTSQWIASRHLATTRPLAES